MYGFIKKFRFALVIAVGLCGFLVQPAIFAQSLSHDAVGYWITLDHKNNNKPSSVIQIQAGPGGTLSGKIVHVYPEAGHKVTDKCVFCKGNLRNAPIDGLRIVWGFKPSGDGKYDKGRILDPTNGKIYKSKLWLGPKGMTLTVRGYIGFSLLGRSDTWYRTFSSHNFVKKNKADSIHSDKKVSLDGAK